MKPSKSFLYTSALHLQAIDLEETRALSSVVEKLSNPSIELGDVYELYLSLTEKARQAMRAYRAKHSTDAGAAGV